MWFAWRVASSPIPRLTLRLKLYPCSRSTSPQCLPARDYLGMLRVDQGGSDELEDIRSSDADEHSAVNPFLIAEGIHETPQSPDEAHAQRHLTAHSNSIPGFRTAARDAWQFIAH